jgi:predicted GH43/DUF377 family glycosyl hydrolase
MANKSSVWKGSVSAALVFLAASTSLSSAGVYPDGRPEATLRYDAEDQGVILPYGHCPGGCDKYGARDVWVFEHNGAYYMHYDAAGDTGWLAALATSRDLIHWKEKGPVLKLGAPGEGDSASASYGTTYFDGHIWHMFYLGTPNVTPPPDRIPSFPYLTMKARSSAPGGPWQKEPQVIPFRPQPGTYYSATASPGQIVRQGDEYLQFFSASTDDSTRRNLQFAASASDPIQRTLSIARTTNLDGPWMIDSTPIVPLSEQVENSSLYYETSNRTWFIFTNHIGLAKEGEYTDAIWVYWTKDLNHWDPAHKAIVLDGKNCKWSKRCIGLPSVVRYGKRLAIFYDAPGGDSVSHMKRSIGLAWLNLPLVPPSR